MQRFCQPKIVHESKSYLETRLSLLKNKLYQKKTVARYIDESNAVVARCLELESEPLDQLMVRIDHYRQAAQINQLVEQRDTLLDALAVLSILSGQLLNMRPYPVQICCALAMIDGYLVQLAPGEGKTLTIGLTATILGWSKKPCYVITTNDYLAQRDVQLLNLLFERVQLSVSTITQELSPAEKKAVYQADVVYGTAKQMLADYLGDVISLGGLASRMRMNLSAMQGVKPDLTMRGLYTAIVDEADSILIDEATTPLIISAPEENPLLSQAVLIARDFVDELLLNLDYNLDPNGWGVSFTALGEQKIEAAVSLFPALWHHRGRLKDLLIQALLAKDRFKLDEHFVIVEGEVILVDEATGRMMHGRSWSYGLHQAVEARSGVELTAPSKTLEKMSFQSFFKSFHHLTGASGTLQNIQAELYHTYQLQTLEIPTRLPSKLAVSPFSFFPTKAEKIKGLVERVCQIHRTGQPILIGTRRIRDTEELSEHLAAQHLVFEVLNAKKLEQEAHIIAQAGQQGKITVSTNMAGRGTDISVPKEILEQGGLCVMMYEPHDSARIDWQLFGRAGRQGNQGCAYPFVSAEDPSISSHLSWIYRPLLWILKRKPAQPAVVQFLVNKAQQSAQNKAFKQRQQLAKLNKSSQERMSFIKSKTEARSR